MFPKKDRAIPDDGRFWFDPVFGDMLTNRRNHQAG
jgi:hypothetical protein